MGITYPIINNNKVAPMPLCKSTKYTAKTPVKKGTIVINKLTIAH
jgi:hypothetical protein